MQIKDLTKNQLWELRQEIVLNSLYLRDYYNSFGIDCNEVCGFFNGYVENLYDMSETNDTDIFDIVSKYDNIKI